MRLEFTTRTDLAIRAINILKDAEQRISRKALAQRLDTTPHFLARVMAPLVHNGWVNSGTGPGGGYEIDGSADSLSVYDLVAAVEGVPEEGKCVLRRGGCLPDQTCALHDAWSRARSALMSELRSSNVF
ncbi:MAG: Rrf2 family transcriptional regulator [Acidimicrobiia bacterium]|nr:Rrf2 family transcriptional regulator [Acidimicrobiia bacterium]